MTADAALSGPSDDLLAELEGIYKDIHAHPELAFAEFETTSFLEQRLRAHGLSPKRLPAGTGLVCEVGSGDPVVVLRADIDAFYGDVFGWQAKDIDLLDQKCHFLRIDDGQFIELPSSRFRMRQKRLDQEPLVRVVPSDVRPFHAVPPHTLS